MLSFLTGYNSTLKFSRYYFWNLIRSRKDVSNIKSNIVVWKLKHSIRIEQESAKKKNCFWWLFILKSLTLYSKFKFIGHSQCWCIEFLTIRYGSPSLFFFLFLNRYCCQSTHYSFVTYYDNSTIVSARIAYSSYMGALERIKCSSFNLKVKKSQCFISPFNSNFRIKIVNMTLPIELQFLSFLVLGRNSINKQI